MEILELVDQLDHLVRNAKKVPITGQSMVASERLQEVVDQMRLTVPIDIQSARDVLDRREQIVNQTMLDARRMRSTAEADARALVDESELMKSAMKRGEDMVAAAEEKADRIMRGAEAEARRRIAGADQYSHDSLASLEEQVIGLLNVIHAGQRSLEPALQASSQLFGAEQGAPIGR